MDEDRRGKNVGTPNSLGRLAVLGLLQRLVDNFAEANRVQQHWMTGLRTEQTPLSTDRKARPKGRGAA